MRVKDEKIVGQKKTGGWITNSKGKKSHNSVPLKEQTVIIKPI